MNINQPVKIFVAHQMLQNVESAKMESF